MPRFTDGEKEAIEAALRKEGERLFSLHGLKKVTVDDLTEAANISKGSFYAFYQSKEHLFMTINFAIQERLFSELMQELEDHKALPPKALAAFAFALIYKKAAQYPLLTHLDRATIQHIQRKLPPEMLAQHTQDDTAVLKLMENYGIAFGSDLTLAAKALQTIFACANLLVGDEDNERIVDVLIGGVLQLMK